MSDRSLLLTEDQSRQIQKAMIKVGALDKNGNLQYDPRLVSYRVVLAIWLHMLAVVRPVSCQPR